MIESQNMKFGNTLLGTTYLAIGALTVLQINSAYADHDLADLITSPLTSPIISITPTPTVEVTPTPTVEVTPTVTPIITITPTPTTQVTPTPTATASPTATPTPTITVTPTATPAKSNQNNSNSNNASNNNSNPTHTYSCNDEKPNSIPTLTRALVSGNGQITLFWTKANGPVSNYQISYGTSSNAHQFGIPSFGDANTTTMDIKELTPNARYFFKVKALNGCKPGEFSNEISAVASRNFRSLPLNIATIDNSATNNQPVKNEKSIVQSIKKDNPNRIVTSAQKTGTSFFQKIMNFLFN